MLSWVQLFVKGIADRAVAAILLLVTSPLLMLFALLTWLTDGPPILFRQERAGRAGRAFTVSKIRTMRLHGESTSTVGQVTGNHPLVTPLGRLLRRSKIDELPQLTSVLRGDMSLVGPRPTLPEQTAQYGNWERRRLNVRPGLTGWAQVNGNIRLSWPERIDLDVWYVDHWSLWLDLRVLARTAVTVANGERRNDAALREAQDYAKRVGGRSRELAGHARDDADDGGTPAGGGHPSA